MRSLLYSIVLCTAFWVTAQNVNPANPIEIRAQRHVSPEDLRERLASAELQKQTRELSELCTDLSKDMEAVKQGVVPKDTINRLKEVERLSKRVREQLVRAGAGS